MQSRKMLGGLAATVGLLAAIAPASAYTIMAGVTLDVHQDINNPNMLPNDFHIEGWICTRNDVLPLLKQHQDGPFPHFSYSFGPLINGWYSFTADWWLDPWMPGIPYCTIIHLGLLFDVEDENTIIKLRGWWTKDGQRIGQIYGNLNDGFVPVLGFSVAPIDGNLAVRVGNGLIQPPPIVPWPPVMPWPPVPEPGPVEVSVTELEVLSMPTAALPPDWFEQLSESGGQQMWPWKNVVNGAGIDVSPGNPIPMAPDSFFDIFLEVSAPPPGGFRPSTPVTIKPDDIFFVRTKRMFINNAGIPEPNGGLWEWHIHQAQGPEACCFEDGTCAVLTPIDCAARGGSPQGPNTTCDPNPCLPQGACCYGPTGTDCIVTDQTTCGQVLHGTWHGVGTNCDDLNGNGTADACESQPQAEACCMPNGDCMMELPASCVQQGGVPKGPGSVCAGDADHNGIDDACENTFALKWIQDPDINQTGIDIMDSVPVILADDFLCKERSKITHITVWGSWKHDVLPEQDNPGMVQFTLSLHADIPDPDGQGPLYSKPGQVLWYQTFLPGTFTVQPYRTGLQEGWWDPRNAQGYIPFGDTVCWQYDFVIPAAQAFCQEGSPEAPIVYWLDVQAVPMGGTATAQFGWKTSIRHWNDDAVWGVGQEPYLGPWNELRYPIGHIWEWQSIDLAFAIHGDEPCDAWDFGDAPDPMFPTLLASNGARHRLNPNMFLGAAIDSETDGQPVPPGLGDDVNPPFGVNDEDGVTYMTPLIPGSAAIIQVVASMPGMLDAWVDFGGDGSWAQPTDQIFGSMPLAAGMNALTFPVPPTAKSGLLAFARFRFSSAGGLAFFGPASDGEVEDHWAQIAPCNVPPQDEDADGDVDLMDFGKFQNCFNGPNRIWKPVIGPSCACFDNDDDGDVDLMDFGTFQTCFNGPNRPPKC